MRALKFGLPIILVVGVIGLFAWQQLKEPEVIQPSREIITIVAYGDSLIEGIGATKGNDFVSLLSEKIHKPIINEGKSGETSAQGLVRIDTVLKHEPDMVIILFGGNDALHRVPK